MSEVDETQALGWNKARTEQPVLDFYLSEMSVSDHQGGGITLQRVLGTDLGRIGKFIHVHRFGQRFSPSADIAGRCIEPPSSLDSDGARRMLGFRLTRWLSRQRPVERMRARAVSRVVHRLFKGRDRLTAIVCPQSRLSVICFEKLKNKFRLDYITWVMDDHVIRFNSGQWYYPAGFRRLMQQHLQDAHAVFVISSAMADLYHEEFGIRGEVLFSPADACREPVWGSPSKGATSRIAYFGGLGGWHLDALAKTAAALPVKRATLDVFTSDAAVPQILTRPGIRIRAPIDHTKVCAEMRKYDAVLLPISFENKFQHLARLNIATKMSECLASGTVTLVVAPSAAAMVRFLQPSGAAYIVSEPTTAALSDAVIKVRQPLVRQRILTAAQQLVATKLSTAHMRSKWHAALASLTAKE
jgi:glycosyltransferase involved in cell wall biosynthesis